MSETGYDALVGANAAAGAAGALMVSLGQGEARRPRSVSPVEKAMLERAGLSPGGVAHRSGYRGRTGGSSQGSRYSSRSPSRRSLSPQRRPGGRSMSPSSARRQLGSRSPPGRVIVEDRWPQMRHRCRAGEGMADVTRPDGIGNEGAEVSGAAERAEAKQGGRHSRTVTRSLRVCESMRSNG